MCGLQNLRQTIATRELQWFVADFATHTPRIAMVNRGLRDKRITIRDSIGREIRNIPSRFANRDGLSRVSRQAH